MKMLRKLGLVLSAIAVLALSSPQLVYAAATTQTTHAYLCAPDSVTGGANRRVVVPTTNGGTYNLNGQGCAVVVGSDIGWFLTQGFSYGQGLFTLRQEGIVATQTASTSNMVLPAYGYIFGIVLSETAGNAISGGVDIGDATSATTYASAIALSANATVNLTDSATVTRLNVPSGVPTADQILVKCHTSCNNGSINITILFGYF